MNTKEIMPSWPRPTLTCVPTPHGRWGCDPFSGVEMPNAALPEMCDYGAARFKEGVCDLVNFDCMPVEVTYIKEYMASHHPDIPYTCGPAERVLRKAMHLWSDEYRRLNSATEVARRSP